MKRMLNSCIVLNNVYILFNEMRINVMKNKDKSLNQKFSLRQRRIFSTELKKKLVSEIEMKRLTVRNVVNLYQVGVGTVYYWLHKYSSTIAQGVTMVVESDSKEKKIDILYDRISELEKMLGRKQLELEFKDKVIEFCSEELGYDVKKKCITKS